MPLINVSTSPAGLNQRCSAMSWHPGHLACRSDGADRHPTEEPNRGPASLRTHYARMDEAEAFMPSGSVVRPPRADETVITGNPTEHLLKAKRRAVENAKRYLPIQPNEADRGHRNRLRSAWFTSARSVSRHLHLEAKAPLQCRWRRPGSKWRGSSANSASR